MKNQINYNLNWIFVFCLFLISCRPNIADCSIDKVTKELSESVQKYEELNSFSEGLANVKKDGKYGYIDKLGHEVIPCQYEEAGIFKYGRAVVGNNGKYGVIDQKGNTIIPIIYDYLGDGVMEYNANECIPYEKYGKYGVMDINGKSIVPCEYKICQYIGHRLYALYNDNDLGCVCDKNGKFLTEFKYTEFKHYTEGYAAVKNMNGEWGFINDKGVETIPCQYFDVGEFSEGLAAVAQDPDDDINKYWGYINYNGEITVPFRKCFSAYNFNSNYAQINVFDEMEQDSYGFFINRNGEQVTEILGGSYNGNYYNSFVDGYAVVRQNYKYSLIDTHFQTIIPPIFDAILYGMINGYTEANGLTLVSKDKEFGIWSLKSGKLIAPCKYGLVDNHFSEGYIPVRINGKVGFLNEEGNMTIAPTYNNAKSFSEGFAVIRRYGKSGYVDRYGNDTFYKERN